MGINEDYSRRKPSPKSRSRGEVSRKRPRPRYQQKSRYKKPPPPPPPPPEEPQEPYYQDPPPPPFPPPPPPEQPLRPEPYEQDLPEPPAVRKTEPFVISGVYAKRYQKTVWPIPYEEVDTTTKRLCNLGGIGAIIGSICAVLYGVVLILAIFSAVSDEIIIDTDLADMLIDGITLLIGISIILVGIGYYGLYEYTEKIDNVGSLVISILTSIFWFLLILMVYAEKNYEIGDYVTIDLLYKSSLIFAGLMLLFHGANLVNGRRKFRNQTTATVAGILLLITGILFCTFYAPFFFGIPFFMWGIANLLLAALFFKL